MEKMDNKKKSDKKIAILVTAIMVISVFAVFAVPVSANNGEWYFKPPYPNYAPSGMPDFDQKQDKWQAINAGPNGIAETAAAGDDIQVSPVGTPGKPYHTVIAPGPNCSLDSTPAGDDQVVWVFCGPVAVANCFWWFDSKYADPTGTPGDGNDIFRLVEDYDVGDDHLAANVPPLVCRLANQMLTTSKGTTYVSDMEDAIDDWLKAIGLDDTLYEHTVKMPTFEYIEEEVERSQDVILLLGFWQLNDAGVWTRIGGHYVTVAGVNSANLMIAISDPFFDNAVVTGQGRIVPNPHPPGYTSTFHNDARNISHDFYVIGDSISPGGEWGIPYYLVSEHPELVMEFINTNVPLEFEPYQGEWDETSLAIHTEVEYAVVISPKCMPAIEVNKTVLDPETGEWVEEINANVGDDVTFRIWIHNNGTCCDLTNIAIVDILPESLEFVDYSNVVVLDDMGVGSTTIKWSYPGVLEPCENISFTFDATVVGCGVDINLVNVTAECVDTGEIVSDEDTATVNVICPERVPALTPIGIIALMGLLAIVATSTILRKRKKR